MKNLVFISGVVASAMVVCGIAIAHPQNTHNLETKATKDGNEWFIKLPEGFPNPIVPKDNKLTPAKVDLGRHLFYETRLSANANTSCGTCHLQSLAFTDGVAVSTGTSGDKTARSAQHLANAAWNTTYTWANPALVTLERQMLVPLYGDNPVEMGVNDHNRQEILKRISSDPMYVEKFRVAFPNEKNPINFINIIKSIASFERTMVSGKSRYDRYLSGELMLSINELRGKDLFFGERAECFHCHGNVNFNDQMNYESNKSPETPFHNTGLYNVDGKGNYPESSMGIIEISGKPDDMGKYRAPSLRNVELTAPYMHDGSIATLEEVVATYAAGGRNITNGPNAGDGRRNPHKSELIGNIDITEQDQKDIVAFLKTLTDKEFVNDKQYSNPFVEK